MTPCDSDKTCLAPARVLVTVWVVLVVVALGAIALVDHRAMQQMHQTPPSPTTMPTNQR